MRPGAKGSLVRGNLAGAGTVRAGRIVVNDRDGDPRCGGATRRVGSILPAGPHNTGPSMAMVLFHSCRHRL